MPSSNRQPPTHRRGRSRQQQQAHQVEELTKQNRRAGEQQNRRWFVLNVVVNVIISLGGGWLFWRLPPQPQGRDVLHGVRGGGTPRITPPQVVSLSAVIDGGGSVSATLTHR